MGFIYLCKGMGPVTLLFIMVWNMGNGLLVKSIVYRDVRWHSEAESNNYCWRILSVRMFFMGSCNQTSNICKVSRPGGEIVVLIS